MTFHPDNRRSDGELAQRLAEIRARRARARHIGFAMPDVDFLLDYIDARIHNKGVALWKCAQCQTDWADVTRPGCHICGHRTRTPTS